MSSPTAFARTQRSHSAWLPVLTAGAVGAVGAMVMVMVPALPDRCPGLRATGPAGPVPRTCRPSHPGAVAVTSSPHVPSSRSSVGEVLDAVATRPASRDAVRVLLAPLGGMPVADDVRSAFDVLITKPVKHRRCSMPS